MGEGLNGFVRLTRTFNIFLPFYANLIENVSSRKRMLARYDLYILPKDRVLRGFDCLECLKTLSFHTIGLLYE